MYDVMENIRRMQEAEPQDPRSCSSGTPTSRSPLPTTGKGSDVISSPTFSIRDDRLYLINPGSVGQPRDRDPRTSFLLYDDESDTVEFIRIPYNITACARKILSAGLPRELADRLSQGW